MLTSRIEGHVREVALNEYSPHLSTVFTLYHLITQIVEYFLNLNIY